MGLLVAEGGGQFEEVEPGSYAARCVRIIDIGTQHGTYNGEPKAPAKELILYWELPNDLMADGRPFMVSKFYTASLGKKANLRRDLEAWRGKPFTDEERAGFDITAVLGAACMLSIIHNEKGRPKISSVGKLPKGMELPPASNELFSFDIDNWDEAKFAGLTEFVKGKIADSDEYKLRTEGVVTSDGEPF